MLIALISSLSLSLIDKELTWQHNRPITTFDRSDRRTAIDQRGDWRRSTAWPPDRRWNLPRLNWRWRDSTRFEDVSPCESRREREDCHRQWRSTRWREDIREGTFLTRRPTTMTTCSLRNERWAKWIWTSHSKQFESSSSTSSSIERRNV